MTKWTVRVALVSTLAGCAAPAARSGAEPRDEVAAEDAGAASRATRAGDASGAGAPRATTAEAAGEAGGTGGIAGGNATQDAGATPGGANTNPDGTGTHTDAAGAAGDAVAAAAACRGGKYLLCEDFEGAAVGALPTGWTKDGALSKVADDGPHGGRQSLKVTDATFWHRRISRSLSIPGTHWGRVFYKVITPAPRPASGVVHSTFVTLKGQSPLGGEAEWRVVDTVLNSGGAHQFLYNVQPSGRGEFGKGSSYSWRYDGKWHCAEWRIDQATQSYQFFLDGAEVTQIAIRNGAGNYRGSEIPRTFTSVRVGWSNFQRINPGFGAWFDDVAIDTARIGCD